MLGFDARKGCAILALLLMFMFWYYVLLPLGKQLLR